MIEINLLPEDLKNKSKKIGKLEFNLKDLVYLIPLIFALLLFAHIYLVTVTVAKSLKLGILNSKWQKHTPQRKALEDFNQQYSVFLEDSRLIQQLAAERISWSGKLNKLSLALPSGAWFNEISITTRKDFSLKGSVVSLSKEEINLINTFMEALKKEASFFKDFNNLELTSIQRRTIGGYEVIDFILAGTFK